MTARVFLNMNKYTPFETGLLTRIGTRPINEDRADFDFKQGIGCWVLADGLGGHQDGEVAAEVAVQGVLAAFRAHPECSPQALRELLNAGQAAVLEQQQASPNSSNMRTTIVVLLADSTQACWAHAGDSRLYLFRGRHLLTRTHDHSVGQVLVDSGELEAAALRHDPERSQLLRNLGRPGVLRATITEQSFPLKPGDVFLLCSDGFWEPLLETIMESALATDLSMDCWLRWLAQIIEDWADPAQDNYTALAIRFGKR